MLLTSATIDVDGLQVEALVSDGDPERTFVLVHGLGVSSVYFKPLAEALYPRGRLVLMNLPGFGPTPHPDRALRIGQFAAIARRMAEELNIVDAVWIGHSMGTQVVVEAAAQDPNLASRIVLLDPVVNRHERTAHQIIFRFVQSALREPLPSALASARAFVSCGPRWLIETFPGMLAYPIEERIRKVTTDVLIASGSLDTMTPKAWLDELAEAAGGDATVMIVDGAHQAMHTHALDVANLIADPVEAEEPAEEIGSAQEEPLPLPTARELFRDKHLRRVAVKDWAVAVRDQVLSIKPTRPPSTTPNDGVCGKTPVVLLPGILENSRYLRPLAVWLAAQGHPVHRLPALGWNLSGMRASAEKGLTALETLGVEDAVIVAHSKGGLIGKAMLLDPRSRGMLRGMVAVATPFSGSTFSNRLQASFFVRRSPLGLFHPTHPDLTRLATEQEVNAHIVSLSPAFDQMIPGGSHLDGATNVKLNVEGHFQAVRDEGVWEIIHHHVDELAEQPEIA